MLQGMSTLSRPGRPPHDDRLTPAEWRVTELIRHGMSTSEIAGRLKVSKDAVKFHVRNILEKLQLRTRKELKVWHGAAADSSMHARETAMNVHMPLKLGAIGQIARQVTDIDAATAWYRDVLRLPHLYSFQGIAFFDCDGVRLFLSATKEANARVKQSSDGQSILYFAVPDIEAAHADLGARGVKFIDAPHMIHRHGDGTEEWMAFFEDNEGRPLAIMSKVAPR
jgi:DNA-binding CsgD family transcriptional regulator/catechol 2,3-dioxygenase-like lactoylglutathione lyase family enzyme